MARPDTLKGSSIMTDEALRRTDLLLTELTELVETARALPMSSSCVLPREHLLDLLDELRDVLPPEIESARTVVAARDRILEEAQRTASENRDRSVAEADSVLADAQHRSAELVAEAEARAAETVRAAAEEQARMVTSTAVHEAAAAAASTLREEAERYQQQVVAEAQQHDAKVRADADGYAHQARRDAERYATKLTDDAESYAERTLDELTAVLGRAAATAEQGRTALSQRRAAHWAAASESDGAAGQDGYGEAVEYGAPDAPYDHQRSDTPEPSRRGRRRQPPISA